MNLSFQNLFYLFMIFLLTTWLIERKLKAIKINICQNSNDLN